MLSNMQRIGMGVVATLACAAALSGAGCEAMPPRTVARETVVEQVPPTTAPATGNSRQIIREYDVAATPPPPIVEVVPPAPSPVAVWVGGYWRPVPHWVWVRGHWR
jgi:hypothetical protein